MGNYLRPRNKENDAFYMGWGSWQWLLDHAGLMWPLVFEGPKWYMVTGIISRMPDGDTYPRPLDGSFKVYAGEARHLARVARNLAEMNKTLSPQQGLKFRDFQIIDGKTYYGTEPMFECFREDWNDLYLRFADWAERSGGFRI